MPEPGAETEPFLRLARKNWWRVLHLVDDLEAKRTPLTKSLPSTVDVTSPPTAQTRSMPITLPIVPAVKLPESSSSLAIPSSKRRKLNQDAASSVLTGYRIPSPPLYRKLIRDELPDSKEESFCFCLGSSFQHTSDEHPCIFAPQSNGACCAPPNSDRFSKVTMPLLKSDYRSVAAVLPNIGTATPYSPVEQGVLFSELDFYTNTRTHLSRTKAATPKIKTGTSTPPRRESTLNLTKAKKLTTYIYAAEDVRSADTPLPASSNTIEIMPTTTQDMAAREDRKVSNSHDLIFPKLDTLAVRRDKELDRYFERTINFWSKQQAEKRKETAISTILNNNTVHYEEDSKRKFEAQ